jgi:hypothetical protein
MHKLSSIVGVVLLLACGGSLSTGRKNDMANHSAGSFGHDLAFLERHTEVIVLTSADESAQVAVAPQYQGRVMTSTAQGLQGTSFGYVHRAGIEAGVKQPHITVLGGEDRFWLGPEGGQFALYFAPGAPFDLEHWQVPEPIDWGGWPVTAQSAQAVTFQKDMTLTNYAGTQFSLRVERTIRLLQGEAIVSALGGTVGPNIGLVAYESDNVVTNTGEDAWRKEHGSVAVWILGMFPPAARATVVLPVHAGEDQTLGPKLNDRYFGAIASDRLKSTEGAIFFRADGKQRGKIGVPKPRARDVAASFDPDAHILTIVRFSLPEGDAPYVSSMWEQQDAPFGGDVVNSYNDGPLGPGLPPLGPFYEIETSSPALLLEPQANARHIHKTLHLQGPDAELDEVAKRVLGVSLAEITSALP